ncbi:MAG: class I SAM-dependent methyltransferase [Candidatus Accumulibacter sp.]|jgi:methylase of polypeptide subunit release factors|nr:class I SAM-dependent methyltransferase [Accumulibacter sp.]
MIEWREAGLAHAARWRSSGGIPAPRKVLAVDDTLTADAAYRLACEGAALLWRGDFQNARQLLQALGRRVDRKARGGQPDPSGARFPEAFHRQRMAQAQRARILGRLLIPFDAGHLIPLRRAPDVRDACAEVFGESDEAYVLSLRELLGLIGAHEWRRQGVPIAALGARIHPHYGVFSPVRGEYVALVDEQPLPPAAISGLAFDIGAGTGVLAAVLARRGVRRVVATDRDERALACARDNAARLGLGGAIEIVKADLFPPGRAPLIVCNPPWVPGKPSSALEHAVYDPDSRMLRGFLAGLAAHLEPGGEGWLILSDLAEHLKLRSREALLAWIGQSGLRVLGRRDARPTHARATDPDDPLHLARAAEITSLWRLGAA